jgi:hypothetical protein
MLHLRTNYLSKYNIEELRDHRTMPMRRDVKSRKEPTTKTPRQKLLIANPFKKKKTLSIVHLSLEIGPSSSGQNIERIYHKHRHGICSMQDPCSFLLDESSCGKIDSFRKLPVRKKMKNVAGKME